MNRFRSLVALAAVVGSAHALAVPTSRPTYTFCEEECRDDGQPRGGEGLCNDTCPDPQILDVSFAVAIAGDELVRDCFYITGKLDADCVWGIEPKCQVRAFEKPVPCRDSSGVIIPGRFYEPSIRTSNAAGVIDNLTVLSDRTVRLAVGALQDSFDGTVNGLVNNGPHRERGEVTVKIYYQNDDGQPRGDSEPDQSYVFDFSSGADAVRVAFIIPPGVSLVDVVCCDDTGQVAVGWDVDHFLIRNLLPGRFYAVEFVGGEIDPDALPQGLFGGRPKLPVGGKTPVALGWFDKNCNLLHCETPTESAEFPRLIATAEVDGTLRIAVSGAFGLLPLAASEGPFSLPRAASLPVGDCNFNGFEDTIEPWLEEFLFRILVLEKQEYVVTGSASLKDFSAGLVNRFPRAIWDEYFEWNAIFQELPFYLEVPPLPLESVIGHGVVGGYCLKVTLAEHVEPGDRPVFPGVNVINSGRNDMNGDGVVDAADLALLLSYWGAVPN